MNLSSMLQVQRVHELHGIIVCHNLVEIQRFQVIVKRTGVILLPLS